MVGDMHSFQEWSAFWASEVRLDTVSAVSHDMRRSWWQWCYLQQTTNNCPSKMSVYQHYFKKKEIKKKREKIWMGTFGRKGRGNINLSTAGNQNNVLQYSSPNMCTCTPDTHTFQSCLSVCVCVSEGCNRLKPTDKCMKCYCGAAGWAPEEVLGFDNALTRNAMQATAKWACRCSGVGSQVWSAQFWPIQRLWGWGSGERWRLGTLLRLCVS